MLNIFNNIVKGIKLNVLYIKSIKNDNNNIYFCKDEITEDGYIMRHNTSKLIKNGASICICQLVAFDNNGEFIPCLYTDGLFDTLTKESQNFIIQHELGHFNLHQDIMLNSTGLVRNDKIEFEADEYAMNIIGKENAIKALNELKEIGIDLNFGFGKKSSYYKELDRRIENLMNK